MSLHWIIYCALLLTQNVKQYKLMNASLINYVNHFS